MLIHATALVLAGRGLLLAGPGGCGKSDLALRLMRSGAELIADDLVAIEREGSHLVALRPQGTPPRLAVGGIGFITAPRYTDRARLSLCVALDPAIKTRLPEPQLAKAGPWHGLYLPQITLHPFEASISAKLELALERFGH